MNNLFLPNLQLLWPCHAAVRLPASRLKAVNRRAGFGLNEVIGISITVMVAALVVAPGIRTFSASLISDMGTWFDSISAKIFATT
jgi:hypothetical protein